MKFNFSHVGRDDAEHLFIDSRMFTEIYEVDVLGGMSCE